MLDSLSKKITGMTSAVSERPHPGAAMEWWFVQGYFRTPSNGLRHFMVVLFQQQKKLTSRSALKGHTLLVTHLDPIAASHCYRSQISSSQIELLFQYRKHHKEGPFDHTLVDLLLDEIKTFGPPRPIVLEPAPVLMNAERLDVSWADLRMEQIEDDFIITYASPEDERMCRLKLSPCRPRLHHDLSAGREEKMAYASIPRMSLEGFHGNERVTGEAWFDHQWGGNSWFVDKHARNRILGWDWFGINLNDGSDVLLLVHRDMKTQDVLARHAIYVDGDGNCRKLSTFSARTIRTWESPKTLCRYPLAWDLDLPEIDTHLRVEPIVEDQEIACFGMMRAVWEGVCNAEGTRAGKAIRGRARMELHGYGYLFDFRQYLDRWGQRIDSLIADFLPPVIDDQSIRRFTGFPAQPNDLETQTAMLSEPVWDMMGRGGKRWRPIFGFLLLEALGTSASPFEQLLAAYFELCHLGSLMIDDIEDRSPLRRGECSVHLKYGTDVAISAGNTLYFLPLLLLEDHNALTIEQRERIYQVMVRQFVRIHLGQSQDIYWSKFISGENLDRWIDDSLDVSVLNMYAGKTAAPVAGLSEVACIIAKADDVTRQACIQFAHAFGVAFQVMDDVLNFSKSGKWTKMVGEDLAGGKLTYVIIQALKSIRGDDYALLRRLICDEAFRRDPQQLKQGIQIVRRSGALETCHAKARHMVNNRWDRFSGQLPPSEAKTMLRLLCAKLTDVKFVS